MPTRFCRRYHVAQLQESWGFFYVLYFQSIDMINKVSEISYFLNYQMCFRKVHLFIRIFNRNTKTRKFNFFSIWELVSWRQLSIFFDIDFVYVFQSCGAKSSITKTWYVFLDIKMLGANVLCEKKWLIDLIERFLKWLEPKRYAKCGGWI